jgi:uncharacterized protein
LRLRRRPSADAEAVTLRLYYASDVHGSDQCWRKFLGAGRFYGVDALIMGGDLAGKAIVPVRALADGRYSAMLLGDERVADDEAELDELLAAIRYNGMYPWVARGDEVAAIAADPAATEALFDRVMLDEMRRWVQAADRVAAAANLQILLMAGNDDPWDMDDVLREATAARFCDDQVVQVGPHELVSCSYANVTPWHSPRELDEDSLYRRMRALADGLERPERAIFNLHVPPFDSGLDIAAEVDPETLTYVFESGRRKEIPVGSHAVRQLIEEVQPLLSLHGHIHESRGMTNIGRTLAINSGSEYSSGRIHGALVTLAGDRVGARQLTIG